jgi:outer membrane protein OmpA-like peptidoglycan-associated protein
MFVFDRSPRPYSARFTAPKPEHVSRKATVSSPWDPQEREADEVAEKVLQTGEPGAMSSAPAAIQRECAECGANREPVLDAGAAVRAAGQGGEALPRATSDYFERRFGQDFSSVRVHTDGAAPAAARAVNARAYTLGSDIVFASGAYAPDSADGRRLLAHELTHVVQQRGEASAATVIQRACGPREIGAVSGCESAVSSPDGERFFFNASCDTLRDGELARLVEFARTVSNGDRLIVHGFASEEGPPEFNDSLSCQRARMAEAILRYALGLLGIGATFKLVQHGATAGPRPELRMVLIEKLLAPAEVAPVLPLEDTVPPLPDTVRAPDASTAQALHSRARAIPQEMTLSDAGSEAALLPMGSLHTMSRSDFIRLPDRAAAEWTIDRLGAFQNQLRESAATHNIPMQLLAAILLNELTDINILDLIQEGRGSTTGSLGIGQIQVQTALDDGLIDHIEDIRRPSDYISGSEVSRLGEVAHDPRRLVGERLQVPQFAIEAAAREIAHLLRRMGENLDKPFQIRNQFFATGPVGDSIYDGVWHGDRISREAQLAYMVGAAYNSPDIIIAENPLGMNSEYQENAIPNGQSASNMAQILATYGLFRDMPPAPSD